MIGHRIIRCRGEHIGFIVSDAEIPLRTEKIEHDPGRARIAMMKDADMPGPCDPVHARREAVKRDQGRRTATGRENGCDPVVIGMEDLVFPPRPADRVESDIARDGRSIRERGNRPGMAGSPVAVDDEARIDLLDQIRAKQTMQRDPDPVNADIPGDMPVPVICRHAEISESPRHGATGMVAHQNEGRVRLCLHDPVGGRIVGSEKGKSSAHQLRTLS